MSSKKHHIYIPSDIQKSVEKKGFHLYAWISPDELKLSLERDFLMVMKRYGKYLALVSIIGSLVFYSSLSSLLIHFFIILSLGVLCTFIYLGVISMRKAFLLTRSAFVIITTKAVSLGGHIIHISDIHQLQKHSRATQEEFEEPLFGESSLQNTKTSLKKAVMEEVFGGYGYILGKNKGSRWWGKGGDSEKAVILILFLYTLYVASMALVYVVGVFFLFILGSTIRSTTSLILRIRGKKVIQINSLFGEIEQLSQQLREHSRSLEQHLLEAHNNDWKDGLLLKINSKIRSLSTTSNRAIQKSQKLKSIIESSQYKDIFEEKIYFSWLRSEIHTPLTKLQKLLESNIVSLHKQIEETDTLLRSPNQAEFRGKLTALKVRLSNQVQKLELFSQKLSHMLEVLSF